MYSRELGELETTLLSAGASRMFTVVFEIQHPY
jgi:hypothetical protein